MKIVIDTSVIIDHLRTTEGLLLYLLELAGKRRATLYISTLVILELWKGSSMEKEEIEKDVRRLLKVMNIIPLSKQLAMEAGTLIRRGEIDNFIDSSIAATSLYLNAQLATQNKKHFLKVPNLRFFKS